MFGTYRLILACLVALSHYGLIVAGFNPGQWAVLSFYVVSGYLMECQFHRLSTCRLFYADRFLRIYPLFVTVLLLSLLLAHLSLPVILGNCSLFPLNYYAFSGIPIIVGLSWSLACEAHFYLLVPLLACASIKSVRWIALCSMGVFLVSPFLPHTAFWAYEGLPGILFAFLSGILIKRKDWFFLRWVWICFAGLLAAFAYSKFGHLGLPTGIHINVCVGYLVALPVVSWLASLSPKVRWDQQLGLLSYPLFLAHGLVRDFVSRHFPHVPMLLLLVLAIAASGLLVILVERPVDRIRYKIRTGPGRNSTDRHKF
jgi:peptidoglycan/LPS O-acetylase OafA/YrhL